MRCFALLLVLPASADKIKSDLVKDVPPQPLVSQVQRLSQALTYLGSALSEEDRADIEKLSQAELTDKTSFALQHLLDPYCIAFVNINPEARVKVKRDSRSVVGEITKVCVPEMLSVVTLELPVWPTALVAPEFS